MQTPRATYRLQFNENFRLPDALALVPYLHALGISHLYASPLFAACPHSTHGYDVCDFTRLNPELGTEEDLKALVTALRQKDMGLVLDIVPNHMGVGTPDNAWWWDVLKNGRASAFASYFDINWDLSDPDLRGKILLPVLGGEFEQILQNRELQIAFENDEWVLCYHDHRFPLMPGSVPENTVVEKINTDLTVLRSVVEQQHYRLKYYADPQGGLNYRRFFAINTLAGVRVEDEKVFNHVHKRLRDWLAKGWLDGLRVDHPDGLRDPGNYFLRLHALAPDQWIVVEKILMPGENLPSWPVHGTTGYDFLNQVNGLFVDPLGEKTLTDFYGEFTGEPVDYETIIYQKKRLVLDTLFPAEINRLTGYLIELSAKQKRDFTPAVLCDGLKELAACFPVYRSYLASETREGMQYIEQALDKARQQRSDLPPQLFGFFAGLFSQETTDGITADFIARFQQLTGAVMAKGVEDTAFYCFNRLISLNEVGGSPGKFGGTVESFHNYCQAQQDHWPQTMLASSTHDTKRSEDVRARLNLLSEIPKVWGERVQLWSAANASRRQENWPDRNLEYLFYQTAVGVWPASAERILACLKKSARESGQHTTWTKADPQYESALENFVTGSLGDFAFTSEVQKFVDGLTAAGHANSLAQTLLKLTAPGIPDIYQGCELWDFSLVDPDNRRPVDFERRRSLLAEVEKLSAAEVLKRRDEGLPKLWMIQKVLELRSLKKEVFAGSYEPLFGQGDKSRHLIAFMRGKQAITIIPRLVMGLKDWADTFVELPAGVWRNLFTGAQVAGTVRLAELLADFPVALLVKTENS